MIETSCLFCRISAGEVVAREVYRDATVMAIEDINPQAPVHLLVVPVAHYVNVGVLCDAAQDGLTVHVLAVAAQLGRERGPDGYRLVINTGRDGGQTVEHVHVHVLAGRPMHWPPG
jgi:histidine triad (HIT) family protein